MLPVKGEIVMGKRKVEIAVNKFKVNNMIIAGGVSANSYLR